MVLSPDLEAMLGMDEAEIVKAIGQGFGDLDSIHIVTGIPAPCIERKIGALVAMGFVFESDGMYKPASDDMAGLLPDARRVPGREALQARAKGNERYVLVVDDEPDIRLFMRLILEKNGYKVLEASNGQNALDLIVQNGPDNVSCVITDYLMPHMNGLQLCDELRKHPEWHQTVFLMTAYLDRARYDAVRCFDEKFMKPLDFGDLVSRLALHVT